MTRIHLATSDCMTQDPASLLQWELCHNKEDLRLPFTCRLIKALRLLPFHFLGPMIILNVVIKRIKSSLGDDEDLSAHKQSHDTRSSESFVVGTLPQKGSNATALHVSIDQSAKAAPVRLVGADNHPQIQPMAPSSGKKKSLMETVTFALLVEQAQTVRSHPPSSLPRPIKRCKHAHDATESLGGINQRKSSNC